MISDEKIVELKQCIEKGRNAKIILDEAIYFKTKIAELEQELANLNNLTNPVGEIRKLMCNFTELYIEDRAYATFKIREIITHELELYHNKLNRLSWD